MLFYAALTKVFTKKQGSNRKQRRVRLEIEVLEDRTVPSTLGGSGAISGMVYNDVNADGQQQVGELPLAGRTIQLYTETAGHVTKAPLASTKTDANGNYAFTNLGALPAGTDYVVAEAGMKGWEQTAPQSTTADTIKLPNGNLGYVVPGTGGVGIDVPDGSTANASGPGNLKINAFNNNTIANIAFLNSQGQSQSVETYLTQFAATYTGADGKPLSFETWCIDLNHDVSNGQTYRVEVDGNLAASFAAAGRIVSIYQQYGEKNLSADPVQAAAVQLAIWELMQDPNAASFSPNADGTFSAPGAESAFSVNFGGNTAAPQIAALVSQYLNGSQSVTTPGAWLNAAAQGDYLTRGQSVLLPMAQFQFGDTQLPVANDRSYTLVKNQTLKVSAANGVLADDTDPHGGPLTALLVTGPKEGQLHLNPDGSFTYAPPRGFVGTVSFAYKVVDKLGLESKPAEVKLLVAQKKEVGKPEFKTGTMGDLIDQIEKDPNTTKDQKREALADLQTSFNVDFDKKDQLEKFRKQTFVFSVTEMKGLLFADFLNNVQISTPGCPGSIIQTVQITRTTTPVDGKPTEEKLNYVEGWVTDANGKAKSLDTHGVINDAIQFPTAKVKSVEIVWKFKVGCGLYKKEKITGERGDKAFQGLYSEKGVFDVFGNATEKDVQWMGPTKEYTVKIFVDNKGNWTFEDGSTGIKRQGTFDKEKK